MASEECDSNDDAASAPTIVPPEDSVPNLLQKDLAKEDFL